MSGQPFKKFYQQKLKEFENYLVQSFPKFPQQVKRLSSAMEYSLMAGGKRLRPILLITTYEIFAKNSNVVFPFAAGLEYIHTYSLIHDDLPCMDDDDLRRGKPTNHIKFGENTALLAGDALLTHAFYLLSQPQHQNSFSTSAVLEAIHVLSSSAGCYGMVTGQAVDILPPDNARPEEIIEFIHRNKTGALITASIQIGAILGGAEKKEQEHLTSFGKEIGKCFQILDDILDEVGDQEKLGKPIGSDLENNKLTYPSIFGLEESKELAEQSYQAAIGHLKAINQDTSRLKELANFILKRDH